MTEWDADVAVLGSGFAGSLCALILSQGGLRTVVVDRTAHPRFAIGESSTPIANLVLRDLTERHGLTRLLPLAKYGTWQRHYPRVVCGKKRGFSYFVHRPGEAFTPHDDHRNELLVAASSSDEQSDTHWLRADVDALFARELNRAGIPLLENTLLSEATPATGTGNGWELVGRQGGSPIRIRCRFVIDGSGEAQFLPRRLGIPAATVPPATCSRAVFSHFSGVRSWGEWLAVHRAATEEHPFFCDDAAQHHLLDGAWMWVLRFNNGVTSAGLAIDDQRFPRDASMSAEAEWNGWLERYPSVQWLFEQAQVVHPPGRILGTGRLPRRNARVAGDGWALLPHTAGFVDPLHSSGIAHSLCGVERLTRDLVAHWNRKELVDALRNYELAVTNELALIDQLVHGCYRGLADFRLFTAFSMLYFAAATTYEDRRSRHGAEPGRWFLCADDAEFRRVVAALYARLLSMTAAGNGPLRDADVVDFEHAVAAALGPYNHAGLCDPQVRHMYRHTAVLTDS